MEYLLDGRAFWANHGVHHPFLLGGYGGEGLQYHNHFSHIFNHVDGNPHGAEQPLPAHVRDGITFAEILPRPTIGNGNIANGAMLAEAMGMGHIEWLAGLIFDPTWAKRRTVFLSKGAADALRNALGQLDLGIYLPEDGLNAGEGRFIGVFPANAFRCRLAIHYHFAARLPAGGLQEIKTTIRRLLLD